MIPFIDLSAQQSRIKPQIDAAIQRVLKHGNYILGPEVSKFEAAMADFIGVKHCIGVSNGTDALTASLMALEVGPGDAVITTPFTFFATIEAIMLRGATPVFADIDPHSFNLDPMRIEEAIDRIKNESNLAIRGIMPVDIFGLPADYEQINLIAKRNSLFVLQDSAQACGASRNGKLAPSHGDVGTLSFFPAKPLGCYGDGGAVLTDDDHLADAVRSIRVHGKGTDKYDNVRVGLNARLDTLQAAILLVKLEIYEDELIRRSSVAREYSFRLKDIAQKFPAAELKMQCIPDNSRSAYAQFVITSKYRDQIALELKKQEIPSLVYYRTPAHQLKACQDNPFSYELSYSEKVAREILALPFHPYLSSDDIDLICNEVEKSISNTMAK